MGIEQSNKIKNIFENKIRDNKEIKSKFNKQIFK